MKEEWRDVVGYEGLYQVSSIGRVKSIHRAVANRGGEYIMKQVLRTNGYNRIGLTKNAITKSYYVHRLVAESFIQNNENKSEVNHKNSIRNDNRVENLEWVTHTENVRHGYTHGNHGGYWNKTLGRKHASSKPIIQLDFSGNVLNRFLNRSHASEETGVCGRNISKVCNYERGHAGGFVWRYD